MKWFICHSKWQENYPGSNIFTYIGMCDKLIYFPFSHGIGTFFYIQDFLHDQLSVATCYTKIKKYTNDEKNVGEPEI